MDIELYSNEAINSYLKGIDYIKNSHFIISKGLFPIGDGKVRIINGSAFSNSLSSNGYNIEGYKNGFNKTRQALRSLMPGADFYYEIKDDPNSAKMRKDLALDKTIVSVDENGVGVIKSKKYFFIKNIPSNLRSALKGIELDNEAWIVDDNGNISISYENPSNDKAIKGILLTALDIKQIVDKGLSEEILTDDNFACFRQEGINISKITLEDALDETVVYNPKDNIDVKTSDLPKEKIITFYEYNPLEETDSFGDIYELINVGADANGEIIWKMEPKIIQNESNISYARRAIENNVRTVMLIPDKDIDETILEIARHGELAHVKEFVMAPGLGKSYLIERKAYQKDNQGYSIK